VWETVLLPLLLAAVQVAGVFFSTYFKEDFASQPFGVRAGTYAGFVGGLLAAAMAGRNGYKARREKLRSEAYTALLAALTKIAEASGVAASRMGLSAYVVRRPLLTPWRPFQARIARVRVSSFPPASTIVWTRGKGFLGECWAKQNVVIDRHIPTHFKSYLGCTEAEWNAAPKTVTLGLTFAEWESTQQRYVYVRVAPISSDDGERTKYVGCVSLDIWNDPDDPYQNDEDSKRLATVEVRDLLVQAATAIDTAVRGKA
jgi:hypothetical protein